MNTPIERHRRNPFTTSLGGGKILSALMLPWFIALPPKGFGVLTTTGRRTGKDRRRCVRVVRKGGKAFLVAIPGSGGRVDQAWIKNIRADPRVRLRTPDGVFTGTAREIEDERERQEAFTAYCRTVNPVDYLAFTLHRPGRPSPSRIRRLHESWFRNGVAIAVEL